MVRAVLYWSNGAPIEIAICSQGDTPTVHSRTRKPDNVSWDCGSIHTTALLTPGDYVIYAASTWESSNSIYVFTEDLTILF